MRQKYYGKKAIEDLEQYAKNSGVKRIQLLAEHTNPNTQKFYRDLNYSEQGINIYLKYIK